MDCLISTLICRSISCQMQSFMQISMELHAKSHWKFCYFEIDMLLKLEVIWHFAGLQVRNCLIFCLPNLRSIWNEWFYSHAANTIVIVSVWMILNGQNVFMWFKLIAWWTVQMSGEYFHFFWWRTKNTAHTYNEVRKKRVKHLITVN